MSDKKETKKMSESSLYDLREGTLEKPKRWVLGASVDQGDIFQVTEEDLRQNSSLRVGDCYRATFSGSLHDQYYPDSSQSNHHWEILESQLWFYATNVQVFSSSGRPAIYNNGLNMVPIHVHVTCMNDNNKVIPVGYNELWHAIDLIDYDTGEKLTWMKTPKYNDQISSKGWMYCDDANSFVGSYEGEAVQENIVTQNDDASMITFYVFANGVSLNEKNIGVIVSPRDNPEGGKVVDSRYGQNSPHSSVSVRALEQKKYTLDDVQLTKTPRKSLSGHWLQDNYYIYFKHETLKEIRFDSSDGTMYYFSDVDRYVWSYKSSKHHHHQYYHMMWPFDPEDNQKSHTFDHHYKGTSTGSKTIDYYGEGYRDAIAMTDLIYSGDPIYDESRYYNCHIQLFDRYGNNGWITVIRSGDYGGVLSIANGKIDSNTW